MRGGPGQARRKDSVETREPAITAHPDPRSERFERQGGQRAFHPVNMAHLFVDIFADIGVRRDVKFHQQVMITTGGIQFGMKFAQGDVFGHLIGRAGATADLDKNTGGHQAYFLSGRRSGLAGHGPAPGAHSITQRAVTRPQSDTPLHKSAT